MTKPKTTFAVNAGHRFTPTTNDGTKVVLYSNKFARRLERAKAKRKASRVERELEQKREDDLSYSDTRSEE